MRATPTVIGSPTRSSTSRRRRDGDLGWGARNPSQTADIEERLVDRQPFDERCGVVEDREHRLARLGVGRHTGRDDDRTRAQPARLPRRPSPSARRRPSPRSWPLGRPPSRRSPAGRAAEDRLAARPTRRTSRGRRAGSSLHLSRTSPLTNICSHPRRLIARPVPPVRRQSAAPDRRRWRIRQFATSQRDDRDDHQPDDRAAALRDARRGRGGRAGRRGSRRRSPATPTSARAGRCR